MMEEVNLSVYDKESERLQSKLQRLMVDVDEYKLDPADQLAHIPPLVDLNDDNLWLAVSEDDVLEIDEEWISQESCWLYDKSEAKEQTGTAGVLELAGNDVDVSNVIRSLRDSHIRQLPFPISTKTFARPKKGRSSLGNIVISTPPAVDAAGSPKLRRRLTTTINPSPALIPHLQQLSRTNNRPLSNCDDLNWEDGAAEGEAPADDGLGTPKRPTVPASLLQRLQELKQTNQMQSPFCNRFPANPMTVSQLMRDIPDWENAEPESFFSLGDVSILTLNDAENMKIMMDSMDRRLTFGGVVLPPGRPLVGLNQTFDLPDPLIEVSENNSTFTKDEDNPGELYITNPVYNEANGDENRNTDMKIKPFCDHTFSSETKEIVLEKKEILPTEPFQYSTATFSRPSARASPARSALPMRRASPVTNVSTEDLARSPARSDGTITPVEFKPGHGTYTRNSPVERNGSEDEKMSTTSDHSGRSHDSIEDLPLRCKTNGTGKRQISTPRTSGVSMGPDDWQMSPISRSQMTPARSTERLGAARVLNKIPHGPMPLKPALIRPTDNFKRPIIKKTEISSTPGKVPLKPMALPSGMSGLPKPAGKGLPTRIPAGRLSSIPRPPSSSRNKSPVS